MSAAASNSAAEMEFWGVEVPAGKPTVCSPGEKVYLHVTQAALGESKSGKANERVVICVKVDEMEVVLGTLSQGKCDQMSLDLIFDRDISLFHNGSSSIYLSGYRTEAAPDEFYDSAEDDDESEDEEEAEPSQSTVTVIKANGGSPGGKKASQSATPSKIGVAISEKAAAAAGKVAAAQALKKLQNQGKEVKQGSIVFHPVDEDEIDDDEDDDDEDDDDEDEDDEDEDDSEDETLAVESAGPSPFVMNLIESDDEDDESFDGDQEDDDSEEISDDFDEDDDDDDEDEMEFEIETPTPKSGKKRAAATTPKLSEKKIRMDTPAKPALGNKGEKKAKAGPVTPVAKTPKKEQGTPTDKKSQQKTPTEKTPKATPSAGAVTPASGKKGGDIKCSGCDKMFSSESALTQHSAAKHKVK